MARFPLLAAASVAAILAACGTTTRAGEEPGGSSAMDGAPFVVTADGQVMVSCGGDAGWPTAVMAEGIQGVLSEEGATQLFQGILDDPGTGEEAGLTLFRDGVDVEWRVLRQDEDSLTIGLGQWTERGPTGGGTYVLGLEREGNTWGVDGWAQCQQLSPVLKEGHSRVEVTAYRGAAESTGLTATVNERACASGRDPGRYLHEPFVVETSSSVVIYWTSEPPIGGQDCQGNPSVDRVVELKDPLGTRTVLDGLSYPPRQVRTR